MLSPFFLHGITRPRMADYVGLPNGEALFMERQAASLAENARLARQELMIMAAGTLGGIAFTVLLVLALKP